MKTPKFESFTSKTNEGLYLYSKVAAEDTLKKIELMYGPFSDEEIELVIKALSNLVKFFRSRL